MTRKLGYHQHADYGAYMPTPGEIELACRAIQKTWTPREKRKRRVCREQRYKLPLVKLRRRRGMLVLEA